MAIEFTPVLVRHGMYQYGGIIYIAIDDYTLENLLNGDTREVAVNQVALLEEPTSREWNNRMVNIRKTLIAANQELKEYMQEARLWKEDLQEARLWRANISRAILEKAEEQEWCGEYDEFADAWGLLPRVKEYDVVVRVRVIGRDEDDAIETVAGCVNGNGNDSVSSQFEFEASLA